MNAGGIRFNNSEDGLAIADAAQCPFHALHDVSIARLDDQGELLGGVIFTAYTGHSIHMHMAGFRDKWASRDLIWCVFDYPFNQLGCKRVFGQVPETNRKALEIDLKLGFKIVTHIDDVFPDGGVYVLSMTRDDCRWLSVKPRHIRSNEEV